MKTLIPLLLVFALGCEKAEVKPVKEKVIESNERRGGNGNGNGNGNGQGNQITDPCANYPIYPIETVIDKDFNITVDTTICGSVIFRWDPQPGFNPVIDTCYTIARYYYIAFNNIGHTNGCENGGSVSSTNAYYYTLGSGCTVWPGYTYDIYVRYIQRDTLQQKSIWYSSKPVRFTAGTRAPWLNNCN